MRTRAGCRPRRTDPGAGWGGVGLPDGAPPDWAAVEFAPLPELTDVIRPGGLANQKAPRLQATLRKIREERGDYSLEFLGDMTALEARDWLTQIDGIGKKTASVAAAVLLRACRSCRSTATSSGPAAGSACCHRRRRSTRRTTCSSASSSPTRCTRRTSTSSSTAARCATPSARTTTRARSAPRCRFVDPKAPVARTAVCRPHEPILAAMLGRRPRRTGSCSSTTTRTCSSLLADQLRADGYEVMTARDGDEALRRLRSRGRTC